MRKIIDQIVTIIEENGGEVKFPSIIENPQEEPFFFGLTGHITYSNEIKEIKCDNQVLSVELDSDGTESILSIKIVYGLSHAHLDYYLVQRCLDFYYEDRHDDTERWSDTLDEVPTKEQWQRLLDKIKTITEKK